MLTLSAINSMGRRAFKALVTIINYNEVVVLAIECLTTRRNVKVGEVEHHALTHGRSDIPDTST